MSEQLRIRTLGHLASSVDGDALTDFASRKAELLLVYLACNPRPHPREVLAELLWDDRTQRQAMANLRVVLSNLRKEVGSFVTITRHDAGIAEEAAVWVDAAVLESTAARLRDDGIGDPEAAAAVDEAVALYGGDFLAGVIVSDAADFEAWAATQRERLHRLAVDALQQLSAWHLLQEAYGAAIATATRLVAVDGLAEAGHRLLMEALARNGQRGEALAQYETCRALLAEELGVDPAAETRQLRDEIAAGTLTAPREVPSPQPLTAPPVAQEPPLFVAAPCQPPEPALYLERGDELARLHAHLQQAVGGDGRIIFVKGEAGAGKTAAVEAFARAATADEPQLLVAVGHSSTLGESAVAYGPFRQMAGQLTGDVESAWCAGRLDEAQARRLWQAMPAATQALVQRGPHLLDLFVDGQALQGRLAHAYAKAEPATAPQQALADRLAARGDETEWQRRDLHEEYTATLAALAREQPLLLILDDLHWADRASLNLLFHLSRALGSSRILLLGTYRPQEAAEGLQKVVAEGKRLYGAIEVDLDAVSAGEARAFVNRFLDTESNRLGPSFRDAFFARTGGHPLFTIELLRALQQRGDLTQDEQGAWHVVGSLAWERLPAQIAGAIEARLGALQAPQQKLLRVAAVEGETFTAQVAARVMGRDEREVMAELSGVLEREHRLVTAVGLHRVDGQRLSRYRFRHQLFQEYLYRSLDEVERAYLHEEVGRALEALHAVQTEQVAAQLAHHFAVAGMEEKALAYALRAGDAAWALFAYEEAARHYEEASHFLQEQGDHARASRLQMKLGLAYHNAFEFARSHRAYEEGFALWQQASLSPVAQASQPAPHPLRVQFHEPLTLNVGFATEIFSAAIHEQLFSGLVQLTAELDVVPDVAQRWEVLDGGRRYRFHLREDVYWSDGVPVTAADFAFAWRRILAPEYGSPNAPELFTIKQARDFHEGRQTAWEEVGVAVVDDHTLEVTLEHPDSTFLYLMSRVFASPVPAHVLPRPGVREDDASAGAPWMRWKELVTNGPFTLAAWETGQRMRLEANPRYHGRRAGNVEAVEIIFYESDSEEGRLALYEAGKLDVVELYSQHLVQGRNRFPGDYLTLPALVTAYVGFNTRKAPFSDRRVRRALALATDRATLSDVVMQGQFVPANGGFVPPGMPGHVDGIALPYDPDEARMLLAEAGYGEKSNVPPITVLSNWRFTKAIDYLIGPWQELLGVEIEHVAGGRGAIATVRAERPELYISGWVAPYPDPDYFLRLTKFQVDTGWQHDDYNRLVQEARELMDQEQRMALYRQAEEILVEEAPIVPLFYWRISLLVKPWLRRYPTSPISYWYWKDVVMEPH